MSAFGGKADSDQPLLTNLDLSVHGLAPLDNRTTAFEPLRANGVSRLEDCKIEVQITLAACRGFGPIFRSAHNTGFEPTYTPSEETVTRMIEGDNGRSEGVGKGGSASATRSTTFVRLCSPQHRTRSRRAASFASSRHGETTGAIRGAAPFRSAVFVGLRQSTPHALGVAVLGIDRCAGLLPPGLVQPSGIDAIKAQFIDELQDDGLGCRVVAATGRAIRPAVPLGWPDSGGVARRCC